MADTPMAEHVKDEDRGIHLESDLKASTAVPKQSGISWPLPADRRLDQLVELANEAGAGTRRNELAAAIVAAAEPDGELLLQDVLRWRRAKVRDVIVNPPQESSVIHFPRYGPGRRKADAPSLPPASDGWGRGDHRRGRRFNALGRVTPGSVT